MTVQFARDAIDIFDPVHYRHVRADNEGLRSLPPWCYTSQEFLDAEKKHVFGPHWNVLDRLDRVPNPGDFFCTTFLGTPILVARGQDGQVRAFSNVCRHRSVVVAQGEGNARSFRCPYHSWTYGLKGELISAPDFRHTDGTPIVNDGNRPDFGLPEIPSATWGGFLFVRFSNDGPSLEEQLGDVPAKTASHRPQDMVCTRRKVFDIDSNWKLFFENVNETYHIPHVHGQTLDRQKRQMHPQDESAGYYVAILAGHTGSRLVIKGDKEFPPIPSLEGRYREGTFYLSLFPSTMIAFSIDGLIFYTMDPIAPNKTRLTVHSCFPRETVARPDFEEVVQNYYKRVDLVIPEDYVATDSQQIGLNSPYARDARLGHTETMMHYFDRWLVDRVIG